jgi:predicted MPP superfamily phosphohydrolase
MTVPAKTKKLFTRRRFLGLGLAASAAATALDARFVEPTNLKVRHVRIGPGASAHRFIHFTDTHHKGDRAYLQIVVKKINSLAPDFVCFTGDLVEEKKFLGEALDMLSGIKAPLFGVPGNHDYWSKMSFAPVFKCFAATGGAWLMDESRLIAGGRVNLIGSICKHANGPLPASQPGAKNILLMHYPAWVKKLGGRQFDLVLAGHSHGGQVRIPFCGPIFLPYSVDEYDMGLFQTPAGPLYVNPGIGYIYEYNVRFNCPPEITVIEI